MNPQIEEPGIPTDANSDIQEFCIGSDRDCDQQNYTDLWIGRSQNPGVSMQGSRDGRDDLQIQEIWWSFTYTDAGIDMKIYILKEIWDPEIQRFI